MDHLPIDSQVGMDADRLRTMSALYPRVRAWLARRVRDPKSLELAVADILGEAYVLIRPRQDPEVLWNDVSVLLRAVLAFEVRERRRGQRTVDLDPDALAAEGEDRRIYLDSLWDWEKMALAKLSRAQGVALEMHVMDEVADDKIAQRLGCSIGSVKVLRHKAKQRLRQLISKGDLAPPPA